MNRRSKALVSLAGIAVAVPVALVLAGNGNFLSGEANNQSVTWDSQKAEAGKNWKQVPHSAVHSTPDVLSVNVSAQMTEGKAKFRIVPVKGGPAIAPGPVLFSAKAANSFTWVTDDTCGQGEHELQWKRAGKGDAVAAKISVHNVFDSFCF